MLRRLLTFWLTCVLIVSVVSAWDTWIAGNLEPDFGGAFENFGTFVGILAVLALPAAVCHSIVALLFRRTLAQASIKQAAVLSALAGALFVGLFFLIAPLPLHLPVKPLLLPCAFAVLSSVPVFSVAGLALSKRHVRAA